MVSISQLQFLHKLKVDQLADVDGLRAFIPGSYIDTKFRKDLSKFVGNEYTFKIEEVDKAKNKIILKTRRDDRWERRKKLKKFSRSIWKY